MYSGLSTQIPTVGVSHAMLHGGHSSIPAGWRLLCRNLCWFEEENSSAQGMYTTETSQSSHTKDTSHLYRNSSSQHQHTLSSHCWSFIYWQKNRQDFSIKEYVSNGVNSFTHAVICSAKQVRGEKARSRSLIQDYRNTNYVFMHTERLVCWKFHKHQIKTDKGTNSDIIYP